jgi:hypothetical protein
MKKAVRALFRHTGFSQKRPKAETRAQLVLFWRQNWSENRKERRPNGEFHSCTIRAPE